MRNADGFAPMRNVPLRGKIGERPWGSTLAALGLAGRTGQLTLRAAEGRTYQIAFVGGCVVGATSPLSVDTVARVALAAKLISPAVARALGKAEDIDRVAMSAGLGPPQVAELKRRVLVQRAARTFSVDAGEYTIDEEITIATVVGAEVDVRAVIYQGTRLHLAPARLSTTLRQLGSRLVLRAGAAKELPRFGFTDAEQPVLDALREGTSAPEIEARERDIDPRMVEAVLCTLAICNAVTRVEAPRPQEMSLPRTPTPREPTITRVPTPRQPTLSCVPVLIAQDPEVTHTPVSSRPPPLPRTPTRRSVTDPFLEVQPTKLLPNALTVEEIRELIEIGTELLERGVDHFTFLGLPYGASIEEVRDAYREFARYLRPERLAELGIRDESFDARSVFAQVVIAYTVLTDPVRRAEYMSVVGPSSRSL